MGLKSRSYGKGDERKVVVSKVSAGGLKNMMGSVDDNGKKTNKEEGALPTEEEYGRVPRIDVGRRGEELGLVTARLLNPTGYSLVKLYLT